MLTQLTTRVPVIFKSLLDRKLDATELLIRDHIEVESLFMRLKFLAQAARKVPARQADLLRRQEALFERIREELEAHAAAEEEIFYPECGKHEDLKALVNESYEEHKQFKTLLSEMSELPVDDEVFEAKLTLLIENVAHHVREEEEKLFPEARRELSRTRLERMAGQMRTLKRAAKSSKAA